MMSPLKVEFQFDFGSPNAYLAELALPAIERRTGVKFEYVPVLLGGIYKATNNLSPAESLHGIKNKPEYQALETQRFIRRHNITKFRTNPFFPVNTLMLMRGAVAAQFEGMFETQKTFPLLHSLAADQESRVARQFPSLEEQLFGGIQQRLVDVRSGVEQADLDRSDVFSTSANSF